MTPQFELGLALLLLCSYTEALALRILQSFYRMEQKSPGIPWLGRLRVTFLSRAALRFTVCTMLGKETEQEPSALTELLDGPVCAPGQLQRHVDPALLVFHPSVCLERDT